MLSSSGTKQNNQSKFCASAPCVPLGAEQDTDNKQELKSRAVVSFCPASPCSGWLIDASPAPSCQSLARILQSQVQPWSMFCKIGGFEMSAERPKRQACTDTCGIIYVALRIIRRLLG